MIDRRAWAGSKTWDVFSRSMYLTTKTQRTMDITQSAAHSARSHATCRRDGPPLHKVRPRNSRHGAGIEFGEQFLDYHRFDRCRSSAPLAG